jgi:putative peptide zinc metalloprotease protein
MPQRQPTFSESWYRIANQHIYLRPGVIVRRQNYRGERWMVLQNPFSNEFFRLRPVAYEFVARLRPERTVQEVWQECINRFPDEAPGQEAALQLLAQLYHANLLHYDQASDSAQLFERFKQRRQREMTARLLNLMFMRFPLLDPDRFIVKTLPLLGWLISPIGALLWLVVVGFGVKVAVDNFAALRTQGQGVLAPGNLLLLYVALVLVKTMHEFGHAYCCRKFGGEVHVMGVLLMIFTPVPYMDATSSWAFRSAGKRALVGAAGMIVELFMASLAAFVWARTGAGTLHSLAYNMMFIASVSTLIFNLNPLLRFDGYYILSDLLQIPNLSQRAGQQLRHLGERYGFGVEHSESPANSRSEASWLVVFGITSGIYRVIVFTGVLLLVADRFLILGILMALVCLVSWVIVPTGKFIHYLATSPRLDRVRWRASAVTMGLVAALLGLLAVVPFPYHYRAPGVVQARRRAETVNEVAGVVERILAAPGSRVTRGQPLLKLANPELDFAVADARARRSETEALLLAALSKTNADLKPLHSQLQAVKARIAKINADKAALTLRAPFDGIWVAPGVEEYVGQRLRRGTFLGLVVDSRAFDFVAVVSEADADSAFARQSRHAQVRLRGQAGVALPVTRWRIIPGGSETLPSPALGWAAGGEVPVIPTEPTKATEPFFQVEAVLPSSTAVALLHGRSGKIRFDLAPQPLLPRWLRRLWQLFQKRYQL